jgi:hypothetical protein
MLEIKVNLWKMNSWQDVNGKLIQVQKDTAAVWICITTNGEIKRDGKAVMGAGIAKDARDRYEGVDAVLAEKLKTRGNRVNYLRDLPEFGSKGRLLSFPTKDKWKEPSSLKLIEESARELKAQFMRAKAHYSSSRTKLVVVLPRPGCNNGKLNWPEVKKVLTPILDTDEFLIISK